MSANSIPNLLSLKGRGGGRSRGRGGHHHRGGHRGMSSQDHDATIQGTDTDAAVSRFSAVDVGLLDDPFASYFVQGSLGQPHRRLPIINRGTYTRTKALDALIDSFLSGADLPDSASTERQIISLGAGTDTRSLRLFSGGHLRGVTYHEIDFPTICTRKLNTVKAAPALRTVLPDPTVEPNGSWRARPSTSDGNGSNELWCHGLDLRDLAQRDASAVPGLRTDVPTLLVSECCLCYLEVAEAAAVVKWFADKIADLGIVIYEPIRPDDAFGHTMVSNLAGRGIVMPTLDLYKTGADQEARLRAAGFEHARHATIKQVWDGWVPEAEEERVNRLEGLDEVEEWDLLAGHYAIVWGWRGMGFRPWAELAV